MDIRTGADSKLNTKEVFSVQKVIEIIQNFENPYKSHFNIYAYIEHIGRLVFVLLRAKRE